MKQDEKNIIMSRMMPHLTNDQALLLREVLCQLEMSKTEPLDNEKIIENFLSAKELEGCSPRTIEYYRSTLLNLVNSLQQDVRAITTENLRSYLSEYQKRNNASKVTMDNIRRNLSSFFHWLEDENYILKSPVRRIHKFKSPTVVKETYTDEEIEKMRDSCTNLRDLAIIDLLVCTGMRIGEMVLLNRDDIDFSERECIVLGKGDKERVVYLDAKSKIHLQNYLASREDTNKALFVSNREPHKRLQIGGIELMLRKKGRVLGINRVHPHKFRRTMATTAIDKGMPIEQLQQLLGHSKIDTTMHYAMVKQSNVKNAHRKYIG